MNLNSADAQRLCMSGAAAPAERDEARREKYLAQNDLAALARLEADKLERQAAAARAKAEELSKQS